MTFNTATNYKRSIFAMPTMQTLHTKHASLRHCVVLLKSIISTLGPPE